MYNGIHFSKFIDLPNLSEESIELINWLLIQSMENVVTETSENVQTFENLVNELA